MFLGDGALGKGLAPGAVAWSPSCRGAAACGQEAPAAQPFLWLASGHPAILAPQAESCASSSHRFHPLRSLSCPSVLQVVIRRRPLFYTVSLLLPSIFLMVMDIVGFYLPPNSGERVSFKITLLLGYSVFLIIVSDTLPATAVGTPLIGMMARPAKPTAWARAFAVTHLSGGSTGIYFVVCMALLVISLTETILIVRLVHKQDLQPHVPQWVKHLLLERATVLLCIGDRKKFSQSRTQSSDISGEVENNDSTGKGCTEGAHGI